MTPVRRFHAGYGEAPLYTSTMMNPNTPTAPPPGPSDATAAPLLAFVGGDTRPSATVGGWIPAGHRGSRVVVVEPYAPQAQAVRDKFGVRVEAAGGAALSGADIVVWAVKPQVFGEAAAPCASFVGGALHLSVMAGIRSDAIARATGAERVVRAMPNTPALIGEGIAGLFARAAVTQADRAAIERVLAPTGETLWVAREADLDAVTALSGSGPAYVFFFLEAMMQAAADMGLTPEQGRQLAQSTFKGATSPARVQGPDLAPPRLRRAARDAARAGHVQGRHDLRRDHGHGKLGREGRDRA